MATVVPVRDTQGRVIRGAFQRISAGGDAVRLRAAEPGWAQIKEIADYEAYDSSLNRHVYALDSTYLVGVGQLQVHVMPAADGLMRRIPHGDTISASGLGGSGGTLDISEDTGVRYFIELSPVTVAVYGLGETDVALHFSVTHTATPATLSNRLTVLGQADGVGLDLQGDGDGIRLRSPNGVSYRFRVDDHGNLIKERV
jgi:hypothetical protein